MRKWVLVVVVILAVMTFGLSAARRPPEQGQPPSSYVVASAEESRSAVQAALPHAHQDAPSAMPGTLPLLFVGSLLLGLAAAVRRTT